MIFEFGIRLQKSMCCFDLSICNHTIAFHTNYRHCNVFMYRNSPHKILFDWIR